MLRKRNIFLWMIALIFLMSAAAPAWAAPCCCSMMKSQGMKCHKAEKKSCCGSACQCDASHLTFSLLVPPSVLTASYYAATAYTAGNEFFFPTRAHAPPFSPPKA